MRDYALKSIGIKRLISPGTSGGGGNSGGSSGGGSFHPSDLFAGGVVGAYWEFTSGNVWKDTARTQQAINNDPIAAVSDLSGNGNHATQGTSSYRPTFMVLGGVEWADFVSSPNYLETAQTNQIDPTKDLSVFCALQRDIHNSSAYIAFVGSSSGFNIGELSTEGSLYAQIRHPSNNYTTISVANTVVGGISAVYGMEWDRTNTDLRLYKDNSVVATELNGRNEDIYSGYIGFIGTYLGQNSYSLDGRIYAVLVISRLLTATERQDLHNYFSGLMP